MLSLAASILVEEQGVHLIASPLVQLDFLPLPLPSVAFMIFSLPLVFRIWKYLTNSVFIIIYLFLCLF